ncbi:MAG: V-type ATPase 116kDa subunit family protein, partial [Candidatus Thermoplasmatota archaeon]
MKKTSILVHKKYLDETIEKLHKKGLMEILDISKEEPEILKEFEKSKSSPDASLCANYEIRINRLIDILKKIKPKKTGIKSLLQPPEIKRKKVEKKDLEELYSYAESFLNQIENDILEKEEKIQKNIEKKQQIQDKLSQIRYLTDFDIDLSNVGESKYLYIKAGKTSGLEELSRKLDRLEKTTYSTSKFVKGKKVEWAVLIAGYISEKKDIDKITRGKIEEFDLSNLQGKPSELIYDFKGEINSLDKQRKKLVEKLREYVRDSLDDLLALKEEIILERQRNEITKNFSKTNSTYLIKGWVLEKKQHLLKNEVEDVTDGHVTFSFKKPSMNPDNPPTHLETPSWAKSFKGLLEMFATPKYNELDPSVIMGFFFVLFFGFMLGDAGYGLVILSLSMFGFFKLGKVSGMIKNWSFMGIWLGLITTIVGFLTNSFFGDFISRFILGNPDQPLYSL